MPLPTATHAATRLRTVRVMNSASCEQCELQPLAACSCSSWFKTSRRVTSEARFTAGSGQLKNTHNSATIENRTNTDINTFYHKT